MAMTVWSEAREWRAVEIEWVMFSPHFAIFRFDKFQKIYSDKFKASQVEV